MNKEYKEYKYKVEITLINGQTASGYVLTSFSMDNVSNYMKTLFVPPTDEVREIIPLNTKNENSRIAIITKNILYYKYTLVE